ncbi:RDD family protein [Actinomyces bowdenii]|uniref:RDD family protein n=1 Tax=Actinomyces bowdenii TaxID=131109 RepID=UPI001ABCA62F|nr:RDD family protein [Actinomyces bowdenii]MBO3725433.1 RDD family protein [Actinomyces bowdenii]
MTTTLPLTGANGSSGSSASSAPGRPVGGGLRFAPVGARIGAAVIDLIAGALGTALLTALFLYGAGQPLPISAASALLCAVLLRGASLAVSGWSLGGRMAGVRLVSASTRRPSPLGVFLRADITLVVMLPTLGLGAIALLRSVAADPHKRGWHDRTSGMMVIATRAKDPGGTARAAHRAAPARGPVADAAAPRGQEPGASPQPAEEPWSAGAEHSWPRVTAPAADPARAWRSGQPPASRTPEEPGRRAAGSGPEQAGAASSWDSPTRPGKISANPVTSQPMDARPAKEQPWQPRPEQAASPAAPPEAAEPQAPRGPIPQRESLFAPDRGFTASSSRHSDVAHTFDTASVLPAADRSTQALIDSVPWSSVPTSLDSTTMDSLPDQIRSAMQHDEQARAQHRTAPHPEFADTESLTPISASSAEAPSSSPAGAPGRHRSVNLLDPQEVPSTHDDGPRAHAEEAMASPAPAGGDAAGAEGPGPLPRSISPVSRPAAGLPQAGSPAPASPAASPASAQAVPAAPARSGAHAAPAPHTAPASRAPSRSAHAASPAPAGSAASPASAQAAPSPYAASPASHLAPPASISAPYTGSGAGPSPSAASAPSASQPVSPAAPRTASHAAPTSHSASPAPARSHRAAQHRAPDPSTPDPQDPLSPGAPRRPVPPTVEVPRVSRRRRAPSHAQQAPAAMPPTMPRPSAANPPLSVRLIPMTGGDPLIIHEPTVVGRDPDNISDYPGAERISLSDPTRSVSKTHAAIFPLLDGVWVTDLHSTNGTRVEGKDGSSLPATPEEPLAAMDGSTVFFGRIGFRVEVI